MSKIRVWWRNIDQGHVLKLMKDCVHEAVAEGRILPKDYWLLQKPEVSDQTVTTLLWYLRKRVPDQQLLLFGNILEDTLRTILVGSRLYGSWLLPRKPHDPSFIYVPPSIFGLELLFKAAKDCVYEAIWDGALPVEGLQAHPRTKAVLMRYLKKRVPDVALIYFLGEITHVLDKLVEEDFNVAYLGQLSRSNGMMREIYLYLSEKGNTSEGLREVLEEKFPVTEAQAALALFEEEIWAREKFVKEHKYLQRDMREVDMDRRKDD